MTLPSIPGVQITSGTLRVLSDAGLFGVGRGVPADLVPDAGNTLLFLGVGLFGLGSVKYRVATVGRFSAPQLHR